MPFRWASESSAVKSLLLMTATQTLTATHLCQVKLTVAKMLRSWTVAATPVSCSYLQMDLMMTACLRGHRQAKVVTLRRMHLWLQNSSQLLAGRSPQHLPEIASSNCAKNQLVQPMTEVTKKVMMKMKKKLLRMMPAGAQVTRYCIKVLCGLQWLHKKVMGVMGSAIQPHFIHPCSSMCMCANRGHPHGRHIIHSSL